MVSGRIFKLMLLLLILKQQYLKLCMLCSVGSACDAARDAVDVTAQLEPL
jgi:hypothetical protein